jgi:hypothetical protein
MRAIHTTKGGKPETVDIRRFATACIEHGPLAPVLGRLIDLLVANGIMNGGQVLHVLGIADGTLEVEDV